MLQNHRRRSYMTGGVERQRPRLVARAIIAVIALFIVWYLATKVFALFEHSVSRKAAANLLLKGGSESVQVSLQGSEWQRGENSLKLYPGDAIAARGGGDAIIKMFDGTQIRLDQNTELSIETSDRFDQKGSQFAVKIKNGRVWVATPSNAAYSGSITRSVSTADYGTDIPGGTSALFSTSLINVMRAGGIGVKVSLAFAKTTASDVYVGEGQFMNLGEDAKRDIKAGKDPYEFRDPVTLQLLKDEFLISSYSFFSNQSSQIAAEQVTGELTADQNLIVSSPENHATISTKTVTVSGRVSPKVVSVMVNGQSAQIHKDLTFSVEISFAKDPTTLVHVEAQDAQGVTLGQVDRTVTNGYKPVVAAPRFKSPVGSGETLTTGQHEIEISGEAPIGTSAIMLNDYKLQLFKAGSKTWSYLASTALGNLQPGKNVFSVYALDTDGNRSPVRSMYIVFKEGASATGSVATSSQPPLKQNPPLTPGTLTVDTPVSGTAAESAESEIVIGGRTSADTASISINGYTLALYESGKTTWNYIASTQLTTMKRGKNVYRIVARNKDGEILDILEYVITYKP